MATFAESSGAGGVAATFYWYGKLPGAGDFVSRRMSWRTQQHWDQWLSLGVEQLKTLSGESGWGVWRKMPAWGFIVPAGWAGDAAQLGLLVPSIDRVGRIFPFLVALSLPADAGRRAMIERAAPIALEWYRVITAAQRERANVDLVDARLADALAMANALETAGADPQVTLPPEIIDRVLPWPDLASTFDPDGRDSYWWSVPGSTTGHRARVFTGNLTAAHFCALSA